MADVVQYKLERMVNELDDLERRGLFSRREIAEIVKQRRKFEYRLKRPSPLKQDYLAYIDYEKSVDALRVLRKKAVMRELKKKSEDVKGVVKKPKMKHSVSDFSGISRIVEIYRSATNRFKGDIQLWFQYLEFCRQRRNGHMKKNLNVAAARALMQSGLRSCPSSEALWVEYLRMELTYLNKLSARRVALGEDVGTLVPDHHDPEDKQWREENKELFMPIDGETGDYKDLDEQNKELTQKIDFFREQGLNILQTVYKCAVEALPSSFSLRTQFLEILEATNLANSENMQKEILSDMKNEFSKETGFWDWLAKYEAAGRKSTQDVKKEIMPDQLFNAIQVYDEALKIVPSSSMFDLYIKFLRDTIDRNRHTQNSKLSDSSDNYIDPVSHVLMVYEKAQKMGCITEDLGCQHVSFLLELGRLDDARNLAEKLCSGELSEAVRLWFLRLSIEIKRIGTPSKADLSFLALPRPGLAFYKNCIEMELNLASSAGAKTHLVEARKLYEAALSTYDQDASLWQDYHSMESKMGTSETAAAVHWRARKTLKGNTVL
ncbi:hypothetical protein Ccrd_012246, partial [Cynara cardunculus var. scolymus]